MVRASLCCVAVCTLALVGWLTAVAATPEESFDLHFKEKWDKVKATTRDRADDVALASEMVTMAKDARPEFASLLCDRAYELADHAAGWPMAAEAMELASEKIPERKAECLEKAIGVRRQVYRAAKGPARAEAANTFLDVLMRAAEVLSEAGEARSAALAREAVRVASADGPQRKDEVRDFQVRTSLRLGLEKQVQGLAERLKTMPDDDVARTKLLRLLVVDLDDPARALPFLEGCTDEGMRKYVPAAAKPVEEAPELACKELGAWYAELGAATRGGGQEPALVRAWRYLERYLRVHETEDLARAEAAKVMQKVEADLEKLPPPKGRVVGPGRWVELLPRIDLAKDTTSGNWTQEGPLLLNVAGDARLQLPCRPEGDYQVSVRLLAKPKQGETEECDGNIEFALPVGPGAAAYVLTGAGTFGNIEFGKGPLASPGRITAGRDYQVDIRVVRTGEDARITVQLDGQPHLDRAGPRTSAKHGNVRMPDWRCPGIRVCNARAVYRRVRVRAISGSLRLLR